MSMDHLYKVIDVGEGAPETYHQDFDSALEAARKLNPAGPWYIALSDSDDVVWTDTNEYRK